jgi:hypothetical protein
MESITMANEKVKEVKIPPPAPAPLEKPGRWDYTRDLPAKVDIPSDGETRDTGPNITPTPPLKDAEDR